MVSSERESHVFFFEISLAFFFFFCLRTIKFFSRLSKLYYSCVFLGDFITCGVHVREGFCEKGVYFNEHITRRVVSKRRRAERRSCFWSRRFSSLRNNTMTTSKDDDSSRRYGRIGDVARKRLLDNNTRTIRTTRTRASPLRIILIERW